MDTLKPPERFQFDTGNVDESWRRWESQFKVYHVACELGKKTPKVQVAIFLHAAGPEAQEIFKQFQFAEGEDNTNLDTVLSKFRSYCQPRKNTVFERYKFWSRDQHQSESIDLWVKELRIRASTCEFGDQEDLMIRDKVVFGVYDKRMKERMLREPDLSLHKAVDLCHASESTKQQLREMSGGSPAMEVHEVRRMGKPPRKPGQHGPSRPAGNQPSRSESFNCRKCGRTHGPRECPAYNKQCNKCHGWHHFTCYHSQSGGQSSQNQSQSSKPQQASKPQKYRQSQQHVRTVAEEPQPSDDDDELFFGSVHVLNLDVATVAEDDWISTVRVGDTDIDFKLDSGAQGNVLPLEVYRRIIPAVPLKSTNTVLAGFARDMKVKPVGTVTYTCTTRKGTEQSVQFYVVEESDTPLLGRRSSESLGLIQLVQAVISGSALTWDKLKSLYNVNFEGMGDLGEPYDMPLRDVPGNIQVPHKIPYAKLNKVKAVLDHMEHTGVIADANGPTEWVNNLVITEKKNGAMRVCLDPKALNKAIRREHFAIPTPEEVQAKLAGKSVFSVFDMQNAYWHVRLTDQASYCTTFHTPWGRKRFLRMPFGICSASEVLQKRVHDAFHDIDGAHIIHDDMIVAGVDEADHDRIVHKVMQRATERNIKFNEKNREQFKVNKVKYVGNYVSEEGLTPDPEKIRALVDMPAPNDRASLQRFLGMVKYLSRYIPNESDITAPLRSLLKQEAEWIWQPEHTAAVDKLKCVLTSEPVLKLYDVTQPVTIQADASKSGVGACLIQEGKPVAYASRALTSAEQNYAQLEKELVAIVFACRKFHAYIYGKDVHVQTDHKPLETILKKPLANASPRVQRMMLRLQRYSLDVKYKPGKEMFLADTLSRAYVTGEADQELTDDIEVMVGAVIRDIPASPSKLEEIRQATTDDMVLQQLRQVVMHGWPEARKSVPSDVQDYWNIRDEITVADGLLLAGSRLIIPTAMRPGMVKLLHESHMGVEKSKARARGLMYWPGLNKDIEDAVSTCATCLKFKTANAREPLIPHEIPQVPFQKVAVDILTFQGADYLVLVDYYSKYPELSRLNTGKSASAVISHIKSISARHGIPEEIVSDNMPFNSVQFRSFAADWGIKLTTSSPTYPQSNGQAERMVGIVKNMLKKAEEDGQDPYIALLEYRNTPLSGLSYSPAQMAMSRQLRSKLPVTQDMLKPSVVSAQAELRARQTEYKRQYDKSARPLSELQPGDVVRYRHGKQWEPAIVKGTAGFPRSYIIEHEGGELRRNRRHLMKTAETPPLFLPPVEVPDSQTREVPSGVSHGSPPKPSPALPPAEPPPLPPSPRAVPETARPRRQTKVPARFSDYMVYN